MTQPMTPASQRLAPRRCTCTPCASRSSTSFGSSTRTVVNGRALPSLVGLERAADPSSPSVSLGDLAVADQPS